MGFKVFMPVVTNNDNPKAGLAGSFHAGDMKGFSWFHGWGSNCTDSRSVPMSILGDSIKGMPQNYSGFIIVFNEPNGLPPGGWPLSPEEAAVKYDNLVSSYPYAKMIPGNVNQDGLQWLLGFKGLIKTQPHAWGFHGYPHGEDSVDYIIGKFEEAHDAVGGKFWITEWASIEGNPQVNTAMYEYLNSSAWIERWAYYTNRLSPEQTLALPGWNVSLYNSDGSPTEVGKWWLSRISW